MQQMGWMSRMFEHKIHVWLTLILSLPLVALACRDFDDRTGSSGLVNGPAVSLAGTWEGQWTTLVGSGDAGTVSFVVDQDEDDNLFGCSCWSGSACWDDGRFSGLVTGATSDPTTVLELLRDPQGTVPRLRLAKVVAKLDIIGDLVTGTFKVTTDDSRRCSDNIARVGDEGTLELNRSSPPVDVDAACDALAQRINCFEPDP
jgi:hypothetical protein